MSSAPPTESARTTVLSPEREPQLMRNVGGHAVESPGGSDVEAAPPPPHPADVMDALKTAAKSLSGESNGHYEVSAGGATWPTHLEDIDGQEFGVWDFHRCKRNRMALLACITKTSHLHTLAHTQAICAIGCVIITLALSLNS
jgi:hypothetical protein